MNELAALIERIESGELLSPATFRLDIDVALDQRDQPVFDKEWTRVNGAVQAIEISAEERRLIDTLREVAFQKTFDASMHSELAAYVADDFGLIGAAVLIGIEDDWLNALRTEYENNHFPRARF